jgi:hypothetical protein
MTRHDVDANNARRYDAIRDAIERRQRDQRQRERVGHALAVAMMITGITAGALLIIAGHLERAQGGPQRAIEAAQVRP